MKSVIVKEDVSGKHYVVFDDKIIAFSTNSKKAMDIAKNISKKNFQGEVPEFFVFPPVDLDSKIQEEHNDET